MKTTTTATGKQVLTIHAIIYVREAFKKTLQFMTIERQQKEMQKYNKANRSAWTTDKA